MDTRKNPTTEELERVAALLGNAFEHTLVAHEKILAARHILQESGLHPYLREKEDQERSDVREGSSGVKEGRTPEEAA